MDTQTKQEIDKELKDIYSLTLTIQAKAFDLMRKIEQTKQTISQIGSEGEYESTKKHSEK
jgi:hypothetical protein